jgi:two-component system nitrate/nitrite response regulator NarL
MSIRVFAISPHALLLAGLESLLQQQGDLFVWLGSTRSHLLASVQLAQCQPDLVLMDLDFSPEEGLVLVQSLASHPVSKVLLLSRKEPGDLSDKAIRAGAKGLIDAHGTPQSLLQAMQALHQGQMWLDPGSASRVIHALSRSLESKPTRAPTPRKVSDTQFASLTARERDIVSVVASLGTERGKALAEHLQISESTLRNHLSAIYQKLGINSRSALLAYIYRKGLNKPSNTRI